MPSGCSCRTPFHLKVLLLIQQYGWLDALRLAFEPHAGAGYLPGRIIVQQREANLVVTDVGNLSARLSGRLRHEAREAGYPAAGDWVALSANASEGTAVVHAVLPRRTALVRRAADSVGTLQVIAANIDVVFVVTSMNADLNPRRLERFLAAAYQSGARPVLVLTKADLCEQPESQAGEIASLASGCPVLIVSARQRPRPGRRVESHPAGRDLCADTAYRSAKNEAMLEARGLVSRIHRKKPKGRPMPRRTRRANAVKSAVRSKVEHVFAQQKGLMGAVVRTIGLARARVKIGLLNLAYNMRRLVWLSGRDVPS